MIKRFGLAPIAAALVGVAVMAIGSQVRAGGDKVVFPEGFDKGVLFTTVDRADNKQFRGFYTSQAAIDAAKKGPAAAERHGHHDGAVEGKARRAG